MLAMSKLLAFLSLVAFTSGKLMFHEGRAAPPSGFTSQGATPGDQAIELRIGLASSNIDGLRDKLMSISTPGSADFRQWLSADEVKTFVQPSSDSLAVFNSFAQANNLKTTAVSPSGDWVSVSTTVGQANTLFGTHFQNFGHQSLAKPLVRTLSVYLPSQLVGHVDVIHPTTSFEDPNMRLTPVASVPVGRGPSKRDVPASCNSTITPTCLQDLYGIPATPATQRSNSLLVTAYDDEFAETTDLSQFLTQFRPDVDPSTTFTTQLVDDGTNPQDPDEAGTEANLDIQYTLGLATAVPITFLSNGQFDFTTALIDSAAFIGNASNPPSVVTTSYGGDEDSFSSTLAVKLCDTYATLGAQGISVLYASGDGGVRGGHDSPDQCTDNTFIPVFPASCPFVTSVGSTLGVNPERAINFTGGGFSNLFAIPSYQTAAVAAFKETIPSDFLGVFNNTGRGYPDASTQGWNFEFVVAGETSLVGGTSASSPTFASVIALINDQLVATGKPVLGFLNPWLYSTASSAFTDITVGKNVGFTCPDSAVAFSAVEGWDPLTGHGTPIFSKLLAAATA